MTNKKILRKIIQLKHFCIDKENKSKIEIQKAQQEIDAYLEIKRQIKNVDAVATDFNRNL